MGGEGWKGGARGLGGEGGGLWTHEDEVLFRGDRRSQQRRTEGVGRERVVL